MSSKITLTELQAILNGTVTPPNEAELKQKLFDKLFAKAIWTMQQHGIVEADQLDFAIEVSMDPISEEETSKSQTEGLTPGMNVTLQCCTGAGCGACNSTSI